MAFIQIIDFRTSNIDQVRSAADDWERATAGTNRVRRRILTEDHDNPGRFFNIVFFDSYEDAMENSSMRETSDLAQKMMDLGDGTPNFYNLDVIEDRG